MGANVKKRERLVEFERAKGPTRAILVLPSSVSFHCCEISDYTDQRSSKDTMVGPTQILLCSCSVFKFSFQRLKFYNGLCVSFFSHIYFNMWKQTTSTTLCKFRHSNLDNTASSIEANTD